MARDYALRRRKALADAVSGVVGSLVSLWAFYPIEVLKTNSQAGSKSELSAYDGKKKAKSSMFQGCGTKTLHTASSSFFYFFIDSWIFSKFGKRSNGGINPATRLFLSAVAAILNTFITLPLDVASSKQVLGKDEEEIEFFDCDDDEKEVGIFFEENENNDRHQHEDNSRRSGFKDSYSEFQEEKKDENIPTFTKSLSRNLSSSGSLDVLEVYQRYSKYWKGLIPALLLCSNPSINYTIFDMAKYQMLTRRNRPGLTLSMSEAFLVGLFSKFVATLATYPLIRAKVILMVTSEKSLIATLCRTYREEGVRGLYKGCDWQLMHTVLKSALMMMIKEKITLSTERLIVADMKK